MKKQLFSLCLLMAATVMLGSCTKSNETTFIYEKLFTARVLDPYTCYFVDDDGKKYLCLTSMETINSAMNRPLLNKERVYARILGSSKAVSDEYVSGFDLGWMMLPVSEKITSMPADGDTSAAGEDALTVQVCELGGGYINLMVQYYSDGRTEHKFTLYRIEDKTHPEYKAGYGLYELRHDARGDSGRGVLSNVLCFRMDASEYDKGAIILIPDGETGNTKVEVEANRDMQRVVDIINE